MIRFEGRAKLEEKKEQEIEKGVQLKVNIGEGVEEHELLLVLI